MDTALIAYLKDKKQFLKEFSSGNFIVNSVVIGLVLSYSQKEIGEDLTLIESLERLIFDLHDAFHKSYCFAKFYKCTMDYIIAFSPTPKFYQIYYRIGKALVDSKLIESVTGLVSGYFSETFKALLKISANTLDFFKVYIVGKTNSSQFSSLPQIFEASVDQDLEVITRVREEYTLQAIKTSLMNLCRTIQSKNLSEFYEISVYVSYVIKIIYKERITKELLNEFSNRLPEFVGIFDEDTRLDIDGLHREALSNINAPNITGVFKSGAYKGLNSSIKPPQVSVGLPANLPGKSLIKIPERTYTEVKSFKPAPKPDAAPDVIVIENEEQKGLLLDLIKGFKDIWKENNNISIPDVKSHFKSFSNSNLVFDKELVSNYRSEIEKESDYSLLDFWKQMIEAAEEIIDEKNYNELLLLLNKYTERSENYDHHRDYGHRRSRGGFNRPRTRITGGNREIFIQPYDDNEEAKRIPEFYPNPAVKCYGGLSGDIEFYPNASLNLETQQVLEHNRAQLAGLKDIKSLENSRNQPITQEIKLKAEAKPFSYTPPPSLLSKPSPMPKDHPIKIEIPMKNYIETLSNETTALVEAIKCDYNSIISINEVLTEIKTFIKQKSPTATLRLIGSAHAESHIKSTDIDVLYVDFLYPSPLNLLFSAVSSLNLGHLHQANQIIILSPSRLPYKIQFILNQEMSYELSSLVKEYCRLDSRCLKMIILVKHWARQHRIYGPGYPSGFHLSLLIILFLQTSDPIILPRLQGYPHQPRHVSDYDVWFKTNTEFESASLFGLGDLFKLFLDFLMDFEAKNYSGNAKQGIVTQNNNEYLFSISHPFTDQEVSSVAKASNEGKIFIKALEDCIQLIKSQESLSKIINH
jgi:predicted nucleotidyltransferase